MRLFVAIILCFLSSVSSAAGISSRTADHVLYKAMAGSSTIKIPDWELVVDGDSLAGKKGLPVPKSNKTFDIDLKLPRDKLLSNLAKFAKRNPYIFIAQGLIDLYFDQATQELMTEVSYDCAGTEFESLLKQRYSDMELKTVYSNGDKHIVYLSAYKIDDPKSGVTAKASIYRPSSNSEFRVSIEGVDFPYSTSDRCFVSLCNVDIFSLPKYGQNYYICNPPSYAQPKPTQQYKPATETDIVQNLDKNVTADKLPLVRDVVLSQNWTLETDSVPAVTGPGEVVVSTQTKTITNPDGTTTTQQIVEKLVYTYNGNIITENKVTQVFEGDQIVETNVTNINNETSNEPVDYSFQPPNGEYPTDLETPEKRNLVAEVLNPVASQLQGFGSKIGLRGSGQCAFDIPFNLGFTSGAGRLDFCRYESTFSTLGSMLVAFAYFMAGLIVIGMRH